MTATASPPLDRTAALKGPPRRIMSIWFAQFAVDRWRLSNGFRRGEGADAAPTVLIAETAHGPRIAAANDAGRAAGARAGMMLADARTLCPAITVAPSDPAGDLALLEKLALWAQRWGPWSALDPPDGLVVDVTAVAHLFGGERRLIADARAAIAARDLSARLAIAPTAGAAWALAHYGPDGAILGPGNDAAMRLAELPVAALRLDPDVLTVLRRLGLKRLGELGGVGRDALQRRFRNRKSPSANPLVRMDQLLGRVPEPLLPVVPQDIPLVERRLLEPIRHRELLDQVLRDLAADMARELEGRGEGARRLELGLWRVDGEVITRALELSASTRDPAHICRLFGAKLDGVDAGFGIELLRLRASWAEPLALGQRDIESAAESHGTSLNACIDRLTVRLGPQAVRRPVPHASHLPERAQRWQPPLEPEPASQGELAFHQRPLKLLDRPEAIAVLYATPDGYPRSFRWRGAVREVVKVEGPERIAPEWWRERSSARLRDYYRIEDEKGRRYWIYRHGLAGDGRGDLPLWYLHGLYG
ncbi:Y-family DNA polymerase [Altererythrobacter sp. Z27]|uniref:Y-family DNA polymerase n=1 Tax=Altererythrobacter sp. Z27 TaxID=3461147 RepID=UPI0040444CD4